MDSTDDELVDLIARCTLRDQGALKRLYDRVGGYLMAVAFRIVKSDEVANEVLQEAFIQIWQNAASYRPEVAKPLTWMTSILRYRALDRLDKEMRHHTRITSAEEHGDLLASLADNDSPTPEAALHTTRMNSHITECLAGLSDNMQASLKLAYLEGFSREEIAAKFNTNANTVKSWLRRGAERLKRCLESKIETTN